MAFPDDLDGHDGELSQFGPCQYCEGPGERCPVTGIYHCNEVHCQETVLALIFGPQEPNCTACGTAGTRLSLTGNWLCPPCADDDESRWVI